MQCEEAVETLGAVEVAPGKWAFIGPFTEQPWWVIGIDDLRLLANGNLQGYNTATDYAVQMPKWWAPNRQIAYVFQDDPTGLHNYTDGIIPPKHRDRTIIMRITADLNTGKEIVGK